MKSDIITYELRDLTAEDMFPMFQIISKIGIKEFKSCFESEDVKAVIAAQNSGNDNVDTNAVGLAVAIDVAGILMSNLPKAKEDIYLLMAQVSGMNKKEIAALPMAAFTKMIIDLIKKDDFKDFFQVVSMSFK